MQAEKSSATSLLDGIEVSQLGTQDQHKILELAELVAKQMAVSRETLGSPEVMRRFLRAFLNTKECTERELFLMVWLDSQHRMLGCDVLFRGTLESCSIHPRVVVKAALEKNASAVIAAHNHPSGVASPSAADRQITERLRQSLDLVEVRLLDHFVIGTGSGEAVSFAERGWL